MTAASPVLPMTVCVMRIPALLICGRNVRDARTGFDEHDERKRIAAHIEVQNALGHAVVGDLEILGVERVNHVAFVVAHGDGRIDERDADADFCVSGGGLLNRGAWLRRDGAGAFAPIGKAMDAAKTRWRKSSEKQPRGR